MHSEARIVVDVSPSYIFAQNCYSEERSTTERKGETESTLGEELHIYNEEQTQLICGCIVSGSPRKAKANIFTR